MTFGYFLPALNPTLNQGSGGATTSVSRTTHVQWIAAFQIVKFSLTRMSAAYAARFSPRISAVHRRAIVSDLVCGGNTSGDHP